MDFKKLNPWTQNLRSALCGCNYLAIPNCARGLSYLVEAVDKHNGEKCLNLKAKKTMLMKTGKQRDIEK